MQGKITKGIAGFYYVHIPHSGMYECKAKGIFRKEKIKPLVGDTVTIEVLDEVEKLGNITDISERDNQLIRPPVVNVEQALLIFALVKPEPNFHLLERILIQYQSQALPVIICFNKADLATTKEMDDIREIYQDCGCELLFVSVKKEIGTDQLVALLSGKTTVVAGPSGVGKSSLINLLQKNVCMQTGSISVKAERGKHTTRHSELIPINETTYIMDTPGFGSVEPPEIEKEELAGYYNEFKAYEPNCRFGGCAHANEPDCAVKAAVEDGKINRIRYENYLQLYHEIKERRRY